MKYYLYIDRVTSRLVKCSHINSPSPEQLSTEIPEELGIQLMEGNISALSLYHIVRTEDGGIELDCVKALQGKQNIMSSSMVEITQDEYSNFTLKLDQANRLMQISRSPKSTLIPPMFYTGGGVDQEQCFLYITRKNNPMSLLACISVPLEVLLANENVVIDYPLPALYGQISVYTKLAQKTFTLEVING